MLQAAAEDRAVDDTSEPDNDAHELVWRRLFERVDAALSTFGQRGSHDGADYWMIDDDWGSNTVQVAFMNLGLLRADVLERLQAVLADEPAWRIPVQVCPDTEARNLPSMGVTIFAEEIIDDLQRDFLPERFRNVIFGTSGAHLEAKAAERVRQLMNKPRD